MKKTGWFMILIIFLAVLPLCFAAAEENDYRSTNDSEDEMIEPNQLLEDAHWPEMNLAGVTFPILTGSEAEQTDDMEEKKSGMIQTDYHGNHLSQFPDPVGSVHSEYAVAVYRETEEIPSFDYVDAETKLLARKPVLEGLVYINGDPFAYMVGAEKNKEGDLLPYIKIEGDITGRYYLRYEIVFGTMPQEAVSRYVNKELIMEFFRRLKIDGQAVEIAEHEPVPYLSGPAEVEAGAGFTPDIGKAHPVYGAVVLEITDENGEPTLAAAIDEKGSITTNPSIPETMKIIVTARYEACTDENRFVLTIVQPNPNPGGEIEERPVERVFEGNDRTPTIVYMGSLTVAPSMGTSFEAIGNHPELGKFVWEVTDEKGEPTDAATIDQEGHLQISRDVTETQSIMVSVRYETCTEKNSVILTVEVP